jgi:hypothetical protein
MLRKQKWALLGGLILLAICLIIQGVAVMANEVVTVSGTMPLMISNVQVTNITINSATISWDTNSPGSTTVNSRVSYGITTSYGMSVTDSSSGVHHSVYITGLSAGTTYYYQIQSTDVIGSNTFSATYAQAPVTSSQVSFTTASLPLHPQPSPTSVILVSIPNPSDIGQTINFGVAVVATKLNGIPTGTVTYFDGKTQIGTSTLNGLGLTSFNISTLSAGSHTITAVYSGDTTFLGSTSNIVIQKVHYDTKTTLTSNNNPSISGQSVTFTANVTASGDTPSGIVTFSDGFTVLSTSTLGSGKATYTTSALSVGSHTITASYGGDATNDVSTSNVVVQVVNSKNKATVNLSSSLNPSVYGQSVSFTATLSPSAATGTVQFQIDGTNFGGAVTLSGGKAVSGSTTTLSIGSHNITATYSGNGTYGSSTASLVQKVLCKTVCTWPSKPNPCNWGQTCIFNIQIGCQSPGTGIPTGTVTFYDGSNSLGSCSLSNGSASFSIGNLGIGSHNISFTYSGDDNDGGSTSSAVTQIVNPINTMTSVSSSAGTSVFGQSVTFAASVTPITATGTVTFKDGTKTLGTATLSGGSATFSINSLAVGSHSIIAVYSGDTYDSGSTSSSITQTVTKPVIGTTSLPNGTKNANYSQSLSVSGGAAPYTWSISGAPSWLSISASGVLTSKPTASGTYSFTVKVTDSLGNAATQSLSIKVN